LLLILVAYLFLLMVMALKRLRTVRDGRRRSGDGGRRRLWMTVNGWERDGDGIVTSQNLRFENFDEIWSCWSNTRLQNSIFSPTLMLEKKYHFEKYGF
jgi:hypothetical protein